MLTTTFDRIRHLVRERSAIVLEPGKEYLVETRLLPVAMAHGLTSVDELCRSLDTRHSELIGEVVDAMTTNETSFFRDHYPFEALRETVIPELIGRRAATRTLRIWCAACSTGQEPYSVAMLLRESFPELGAWTIRITATDISKNVLDRASGGRFRQIEVNRGVPSAYLSKYFVRDGLEWEIRPEIRRMVSFSELNLIREWPQLETQDVVFLRNVLIYFDSDTKRAIFARTRRHLTHDGFLFLGGAETVPNDSSAFERVVIPRAGCYRAAKHM